jgi:hypothetical protein
MRYPQTAVVVSVDTVNWSSGPAHIEKNYGEDGGNSITVNHLNSNVTTAHARNVSSGITSSAHNIAAFSLTKNS